MSRFKRFLGLTAAVLALGIGAAGCTQVKTGEVGVVSVFGKINPDEVPVGVYETVTKTVTKVSTREHTLKLDDLHPKTKNNITMSDVDLDVRFSVSPGRVADVMSRLAGDLSEVDDDLVVGYKFVSRHAREAVYETVAKFDAGDIHLKRDEIAAEVVRSLQHQLDKDIGAGTFVVTGSTVRSLLTDPKLEEAIRAAAQVEFDVRRKKQQIELAEADAEVKRAEARGQADANRIVSESLTPLLMRKLELETQGRFAGNGTHTVVLGGSGSGVLVNAK